MSGRRLSVYALVALILSACLVDNSPRTKADDGAPAATAIKRPVHVFNPDADDARRERREQIAIVALQGITTRTATPPSWAAKQAVEYADALIAELDK